MIEESKHFALAITCGAKRGPKDSDLTFSPASLRDFLKAIAEQAQPVGQLQEETYGRGQVMWFNKPEDQTMLYTIPPPRQPLTDEQKDAARWRFLVDNSFDKDGVTQFHVWEHSWEPHSQTGEQTEWKQRVRGPALDRFIDRSIEAAHGIKGEA
jgi:hypothetical protein